MPEKAFAVSAQTLSGTLTFNCIVRRHKRARHMRLTVNHKGEAVLTLPQRCALRDGLEFVRSKGDWISESFQSKAAQPESLDVFLERQGWLSALGKKISVSMQATQVAPFYVFSKDEQHIEFRCSQKEPDLLSLIRDFSKTVIPARTQYLADMHNIGIGRITVRDQSSRWGSCSSGKNLSLNWRLVLLPPELQDHILLHELAHIQEMNHSSRFWKLLTQYDPHAKLHDRRITQEWSHIMSIGRS